MSEFVKYALLGWAITGGFLLASVGTGALFIWVSSKIAAWRQTRSAR